MDSSLNIVDILVADTVAVMVNASCLDITLVIWALPAAVRESRRALDDNVAIEGDPVSVIENALATSLVRFDVPAPVIDLVADILFNIDGAPVLVIERTSNAMRWALAVPAPTIDNVNALIRWIDAAPTPVNDIALIAVRLCKLLANPDPVIEKYLEEDRAKDADPTPVRLRILNAATLRSIDGAPDPTSDLTSGTVLARLIVLKAVSAKAINASLFFTTETTAADDDGDFVVDINFLDDGVFTAVTEKNLLTALLILVATALGLITRMRFTSSFTTVTADGDSVLNVKV